MLKNRLYVLGNAASAIQQAALAGVLFILTYIHSASLARERIYDRCRIAPYVDRNFRAIAHRGATLIHFTHQGQ